jgi:hypothetical protein
MRKALVIGGSLIALYLVVGHVTGAGNLLLASGQAISGVTKTFQGR